MSGISAFATLLALLVVPKTARANDVTVNCPAASINAAIAALPPAGPNSITVTGTCNENVVLANERSLTIIAGPGGAQIVGPQDSDVFDISTSQDIHLENLEIIGTPGSMPGSGGAGVSITEASDVHIDGCNIHDNQGVGVAVKESVLFLRKTAIQNNNPSDGLDVLLGSTADILGTTIQNNGSPGGLNILGPSGGDGVFVAQNSIANFRGNNFIQNNADIGIFARNLSTVAFQGNANTIARIEGHNISGIYIDEGAHIQVNGPILVQGNGVACPSQTPCGGIVGLENATLELNAGTINGNQGAGISVGQGSNARLGGVTVSNNSGDGVDIRTISIADFNGTPGSGNDTITGNGGASIHCDSRSLALGNLSGFSKVRCEGDGQR